ncbi:MULTISPECIES: SsrA-binding protein SmpB [Sorangium]|uniref:SsrA-binding protein SmpB n=1 Tax=Sorangium TaxID=39643 RepID=UPI003D9A1C2C
MSRADKEKEREGEKLIVRNKRATFDYTLEDRYEAGLVLLGSEVKMLRDGAAELTDSWCAIENGEVFLKGVNIPVMPQAAFGHEPKRARKLLLHESEIEAIRKGVEREGMTVIATRLYFKNGRVKVEIALAKGKKTVDKRESLKEKDAAREARAAIERARGGGGRGAPPRAARSENRARPRRPE